jgi:hypothetical protein
MPSALLLLACIFSLGCAPGASDSPDQPWSSHSVGDLHFSFPAKPVPQSLPMNAELSAMVEAMDAYSALAEGTAGLNIARAVYRPGIKVDLKAAADGGTDLFLAQQQATIRSLQRTDTLISGLPTRAVSMDYEVVGQAHTAKFLHILRGQEMWQVQVFAPPTPDGEQAIRRVIESLSITPG